MKRATRNPLLKRLRIASAVQIAAVILLTPGMICLPTQGWSNPSGGVVAAGAAEIDISDLAHLKVFQSSDRAVINWESFNISAGEITEFIQPSSSAVALSRVLGGDPSAIYGTLKANGGHILVNQNGILVGPGGVVDVGGLNVLSTLDIDDGDFMAGGDMRFVGSTDAGVTNFGTITSAEGDVILMGNFVENNGQIGALNGTVALGAGGEILLHSSGDAKISILRGGVGGDTGVNNTGTITGAAVEMKAHGNVYALAVNNSGTIRATGANRVNGRVILSATGDGSASGKIVNSGTIEANNSDGSGGEILIDAGVAGEAEIGGTVKADGVGGKDGGTITVLGDIINVVDGALVSASGRNGGTVALGSPTSSSVNVGNGATVQATGTSGRAGSIQVQGVEVGIGGELNATSQESEGGEIMIEGADVSTEASAIINTGGFTTGGVTKIEAGDRLFIGGGQILSEGETDQGGDVVLTSANEVTLASGTVVSVDGPAGMGTINLGGGFQGNNPNIQNAQTTTVEEGVTLSADSTVDGHAGGIVVWSDQDTFFGGSASARAEGIIGNGGLIEISGKEHLTMRGEVTANSVSGKSGTVLFDPGDVLVGNTGTADIQNSTINNALQGGTSIIIFTESGDITFMNTGIDNDRHDAIQWTNSEASFGAFASGNIFVDTHIRTSGGGSINLIAGWGGSESDFEDPLSGGIFTDLNDNPYFIPNANDDSNGPRIYDDVDAFDGIGPEFAWETYVEAGQFGFDNGVVFINRSTSNRHVVVGSRYGNTNVAAGLLLVTAAQGNTGESDYAQLGFRDSGQVFAVRGTHGYDGATLDLNNPGSYSNGDRSPYQVNDDVVVGVNDPTYYHDLNGDTIPDGVYAINSSGVLDYDQSNGSTVDHSGGDDPTMIPFASHFMSERYGNWWWQQIDAENPDQLGLGGRIPEMGAGQSESVRADINVVTTGAVVLSGGGRHQDYAQIGHGGDATAWADDRGLRNTNMSDNAQNIDNEWHRLYSFNGAQQDRGNTAIARLAPVYGNINVLAGVDPTTVSYDKNDLEINLTGETPNQAGVVSLQAWQPTNSSNSTTNPEQNNNSESYVQIGHLGTGQFGSVVGDIKVQAGGDITIKAGSHTRSHATIGHTMNGYTDWNPPANEYQQIRFFGAGDDFDNPNLRKGELFLAADGSAARGFYEAGTQDSFDDDFYDTDGDLDNDGFLDSDGTTPVAVGIVRSAAADGTTHVAGLTGFTEKTIVGDIRVDSYGQSGIEIKGYSNPDTRTRTSDDISSTGDLDGDGVGARIDGTDDPDDTDGLQRANDRRFAGIGHGGSNFNYWSNVGNERVRLRISAGESEAVELSGQDNATRIDRGMTGVNLIGDIIVNAHNGNIDMAAGNDTFDYAYIGHGGSDLSDYETSNVTIGDITVTAAGDLTMLGAGVVSSYTGAANRDFYSHIQIGHHGRDVGTQFFGGDISVNVGGDITMFGGRYRDSPAKIGHQTTRSFGQVGGTFTRDENFIFSPTLDNGGYDLSAEVTDSQVSLTYGGVTDVYEISGNTSNIEVTAGGDILMTHPDPGLRETQNQVALEQLDNNTSNDYHDIERAYVQIGHGGRDTAALRTNNDTPAYYYKDKSGDITVNAGTLEVDSVTGQASVSGGNITLQNGAAQEWWTIIGHALGIAGGDRANGPDTVEGSFNLFGNINVNALGDLDLDADFAPSNDPTNIFFTVGEPAFYNLVRIGHGAIYNNLDIISLNDGTLINGIASYSNININTGNDMRVKGGRGASGTSFAQVGHGYNSDFGNDPARPSGFNGDITVNVGHDLLLEATHQAVIEEPAGTFIGIEAGAAVIGHGGHLLDSDLSGNISVYVGNDLTMIASDRTKAENDPGQGARDANGNPIGSFYGIAKIGHWSTELDALTSQGPVDSNQEGDITVVVGNDMTMIGGTTSLDLDQNNPNLTTPLAYPLVFAYTQVGHSGPGINGLKVGDITVLVGNDLVTVDGRVNTTGEDPPALTNYVMIGNGDWLRDGPTAALPAEGGPGLREGNIVVAAGRNITLDHTLIGHADPAVMSSTLAIASSESNTFIASNRNTPFYQDPSVFGTEITGLTASNGTVFSSGFYGGGTQVRLYIPQRELNNIDAATTRINRSNVFYRGVGGTAGASFTSGVGSLGQTWDPTRNGGAYAGDSDEIYLQPDLYWDHLFTTTALGDPAPGPFAADWRFNGNASLQEWILQELDFSSLSEGPNAEEFFALVNPELGLDSMPNGQVASVASPGGLPNLVAFAAGAQLGSGTTDYRGTTTARYTVYYDAIEPVAFIPPPPVITPEVFVPPVEVIEEPIVEVVVPFDFLPFLFLDKFDAYDRDDLWLFGSYENYIEGLGLISRYLNRELDEAGVGISSEEGEGLSALALLLGLPVDEESEEEEADTREKNLKRNRFMDLPAGTFWQYQPYGGAGHYSSFNVFGSIGL